MDRHRSLYISIFPNPTSASLSIRFHRPLEDAQVKVFNLAGALLYEEFVHENSAVIDIGSLEYGLYLIAIDIGHQTYVKRIFKNTL